MAAANAVNLGYATQEQALSTLIALEQRHAAQIQAVSSEQQRQAQAATSAAAANDNLAATTNRLAAANDNARGSTANVAAQFQDIGVTAAMGMSPMMIALQQGTQLSAVLSTMQNPIRGLASAFMSVLNPVSLLTIGFVALAAAAIQWFMSSRTGAESASEALESHSKWLDSLLSGYEDVRDAAKQASEVAATMPEGVVRADLEADLFTQAKAAQELQQRLSSAREELTSLADTAEYLASTSTADVPVTGAEVYIAQIRALENLKVSATATREELDAAMVTAKNVFNSTDDEQIKWLANEQFELAKSFRVTADNATATKGALEDLNMTDLSGMEDWSTITADLADWEDELDAAARRAAAGIKASLDAALQAAAGYGTAAGAANIYAGSLQRLQALIPAVAAAQQAQNTLAGAQISYDQGKDALEEQRAGGLGRDAYQERLDALNSAYEEAQRNVTGLAAMDEQLSTLASQNAIDALSGREQAVARVNQQYADQAKAIEATLANGADKADVDRLLTTNAEQLSLALQNTNAQFDTTAAAGAGRAAAKTASEVEKLADAYKKVTDEAREFIAEQQLQVQTLGMSEEAANRLRYEQELLNKAANDNAVITPAQRQELASLADQMATTEASAAQLTDAYNFGKQTFGSFMSDFRRDLMNGTSLWDSFASAGGKAFDAITSKALEMLSNSVWDMLANALMPLFGGQSYIGGTPGAPPLQLGYQVGVGHSGATIGSAVDTRAVPAALFTSVNRHHTGTPYLQPGEVPFIGKVGEEIGWPDQLRRKYGGAANQNSPAVPSVRVEVHNHSGQPVQQEQVKGSDGADVTRIIIGAVNKGLAEGRFDNMMGAAYGVKRRGQS